MKKFKRVYIEITNICNKNCSFCSTSNRHKRSMSLTEFEHILKEIKPFTNYIYLHVKGEPLLHPNFREILELCNQYQIFVNITTNGTLLEKRMEDLKEVPIVRQLNISLHSFEDEDQINYVTSILENISKLKKERDLIIVYRFWALQNLNLSKENQKIVDILVEYYQLEQEIQNKIQTEKNIKIENDIYINKHELFQWPSLGDTDETEEGFCYGLSSQIAILSDGTVVPCCLDSEGIIDLGNIFETSFSEIVKSERAKSILFSFRNHKVIEKLCQKCKYRRMLKRGIM